ncbi:hypothetical protein [Quadrisphaera sp. INWT6]|uniref:hypothetical protein n=1 Tax=Quadrisphaera sp. INWT6 TaxID=2596917 RepID=UPI0018923ECA|nr:hypothetical protein [Quadrisphaera sp. INWT6]MBF5081177.1 hypothetical protein [Quadrisphaera sp. INWT6]
MDTDADPASHHDAVHHELIPTGPADGGTPSGRERLGHSSIAITANLCTHVYDSVALDGADRLVALLAASAGAGVGEMLAPGAGEASS